MTPSLGLSQSSASPSARNWLWVVGGFILAVFILEYSTPAPYIFGYLYTAPILISSTRLKRSQTIQVALMAIILTLLNAWIPNPISLTASTMANRMIAAMALGVTAFLGDRNQYYQEDIAQKQAQIDANEKLMQLREDFTFTLTHDLKTPVLGALEALQAFKYGSFGSVSTIQHSVIDTMIRSHQTSLQLLETLLDVYRNDTEGLALVLKPVELTGLAEETSDTLRNLAMSRRVYLSFTYGTSNLRQNLWVRGDRLQLQRVFTNLLLNAINHSRRGDRIMIVLEARGAHQVIKILDTGSGILAHEFSNLFDRFYQGTSDRQAKGTGLGLYLSRQIIEAHGGKIWAENRAPVGALFGFKLPAIPSPVSPHA